MSHLTCTHGRLVLDRSMLNVFFLFFDMQLLHTTENNGQVEMDKLAFLHAFLKSEIILEQVKMLELVF